MWDMAWPIGLVVLSSVVYSASSKMVSSGVSPLTSIVVTYLVAAVFAVMLYFVTGGRDLVGEARHLNWASLVIGFAVVGIDFGVICAYRAGWSVSRLPVVQSALVTVSTMAVGALVFKEVVTIRQVLGVAACLAGLVLIMA